MTDPKLTEIVCVIDRSGSMESLVDDAVGGFNAFLEEQKALPGSAQLTLVLFNDLSETVIDGRTLDEVPRLTRQTYRPQGSTALLDAVATTIDKVGKRLYTTPEKRRPAKVIVAILTDGLENASRYFTRKQLFAKITHQKEKYGWEFLFLAANQDAVAEGASIGVAPDKSFNFDANSSGTRGAYRSISITSADFRGSGSSSGRGGKPIN